MKYVFIDDDPVSRVLGGADRWVACYLFDL